MDETVTLMRDYNGFSGAQRLRALAWANKGYAAGTRERATVCDACGQTQGALERHSEDYSEPFGDNIGAFRLCYTCHMFVHTRHRSPAAWQTYREVVSAGGMFPPMWTRNFYAFRDAYLNGKPFPEARYRDQPPTRRLLDEIQSSTITTKVE